MGFAELPATVVAGIVNLELLVHAWDFATAIGQELHVSAIVSDHVTRLAEETISDQYGPAAASLQRSQWQRTAGSLERLLAFTGRSVSA
jgi:uncharacterized protein (TIGR03086 family)